MTALFSIFICWKETSQYQYILAIVNSIYCIWDWMYFFLSTFTQLLQKSLHRPSLPIAGPATINCPWVCVGTDGVLSSVCCCLVFRCSSNKHLNMFLFFFWMGTRAGLQWNTDNIAKVKQQGYPPTPPPKDSMESANLRLSLNHSLLTIKF